MNTNKKQPYEKPEVVRHGNLKEITLTSFTPPPPGSRTRTEANDL